MEIPKYHRPDRLVPPLSRAREAVLPPPPFIVRRTPRTRLEPQPEHDDRGVFRADELPMPARLRTIKPKAVDILTERKPELDDAAFARAIDRATGLPESQALRIFDIVSAKRYLERGSYLTSIASKRPDYLPEDRCLAYERPSNAPKTPDMTVIAMGNLSVALLDPALVAFSPAERSILTDTAEVYADQLIANEAHQRNQGDKQ